MWKFRNNLTLTIISSSLKNAVRKTYTTVYQVTLHLFSPQGPSATQIELVWKQAILAKKWRESFPATKIALSMIPIPDTGGGGVSAEVIIRGVGAPR